MRKHRRDLYTQKIDDLIAKGASGKRPGDLDRHKAKLQITKVKDAEGQVRTRKMEIAEVFATF